MTNYYENNQREKSTQIEKEASESFIVQCDMI